MPSFILENLEGILVEWESFAKTLAPASATMDSPALRDHAQQMLEAIAKDLETSQSDDQQALKSKGLAPVSEGVQTAAAAHGVLRHAVGFDMRQMVAEFRALRASVLRLWLAKKRSRGSPATDFNVTRFNEAVDQALAESTASYSDELADAREMFLSTFGRDLRHPLRAMSGALNNFSASGDDANRAEAFAVGTRSVSSMSGMIRDISEYTRTRLEKGIVINPSKANLETVCAAAVNEVSIAYPQSCFRFEAGGTLDGVFDPERIQQLVSNLLNNMAQRGKRGTPISLILRGDEETLTLSMANATSTHAMVEPPIEIPMAIAGSRTAATSGLALFVAREIVLAHGGTIRAAAAGSGTSFTVVLPRASPALAVALAANVRSPGLRKGSARAQPIY